MKAQAGIGTLILFISLVLVAAIAAGILIQTANSFQSRALQTGKQAQSGVSVNIVGLQMYGKDASVTNAGVREINRSYLKIKLGPGSDPIKLSEARLEVHTPGSKASLTYSSSLNCSQEDAGPNGLFNTTTNPGAATYYGVRYLIGGTESGYLQNIGRQDVAELCFALPEAVNEGESISVTFGPKIGNPLVITTKTPDVMLTQQVVLFP